MLHHASYIFKELFKNFDVTAFVLDWKQREIGKDQDLQFFPRSRYGPSYWENGA